MHKATRWSSTFSMVQRYDKICGAHPTLDHATVAKHGIAGFLLTPEETEAARILLKSLHEQNEESHVNLSWLTPTNPTELRQWLGIANLHKYTKDYAKLIQPLSSPLKKDTPWVWREEHQAAFDSVKRSLSSAPVLMLADESKPFHVVCDTTDFVFVCALIQFDDKGRERVISYQLKPVERKCATLRSSSESTCSENRRLQFTLITIAANSDEIPSLVPAHGSLAVLLLRVRLRGTPFSPLWLAQIMIPTVVLVTSDAEDEDLRALCVTSELNLTSVVPTMSLRDQIATAYENDTQYAGVLSHLRAPSEATLDSLPLYWRSHRAIPPLWLLADFDAPRVVVPKDEDLRARIIHEYHDAQASGHLGCDKTFAAVAPAFFWPPLYKWVRKWVCTCETFQRTTASSSGPYGILELCFDGLRLRPTTRLERAKMVHLIPVPSTVTAEESAAHFVDTVFRLHGLPDSIVSDRDPRFTCASQLRDVVPELEFIPPLTEFALNNAEHVSTDLTPFFVNSGRHPRVPAMLVVGRPTGNHSSTLGVPLRTYPHLSNCGHKCKCGDPTPSEESFCCTLECSAVARVLGRARLDRSRWHPSRSPLAGHGR
ncbi:LOW QUALITY PROTEIN: Pol Polyprotein [Phytophthora megakarya]|uniref:Pol Polyprotein n=1 Tax=Phytophthora megakarya TaxID=4795 RepID=A0A225VX41_9STRA|nr:LOW QUALITY PROTEIN: Pol Polyprotein [Phytophthora megakarya]